MCQKAKATAKKIEGTQETLGNITSDGEAQIKGKVKQAEGEIIAFISNSTVTKVILIYQERQEAEGRRQKGKKKQLPPATRFKAPAFRHGKKRKNCIKARSATFALPPCSIKKDLSMGLSFIIAAFSIAAF